MPAPVPQIRQSGRQGICDGSMVFVYRIDSSRVRWPNILVLGWNRERKHFFACTTGIGMQAIDQSIQHAHPTTSNTPVNFKSLDSLRGVCAILAALYDDRFLTFIKEIPAIHHGWLFVNFFFMLSGFVIAYTYKSRLILTLLMHVLASTLTVSRSYVTPQSSTLHPTMGRFPAPARSNQSKFGSPNLIGTW